MNFTPERQKSLLVIALMVLAGVFGGDFATAIQAAINAIVGAY